MTSWQISQNCRGWRMVLMFAFIGAPLFLLGVAATASLLPTWEAVSRAGPRYTGRRTR